LSMIDHTGLTVSDFDPDGHNVEVCCHEAG
jgi:hypothetical protein